MHYKNFLIIVLFYSLVGCSSFKISHWKELEKKEFSENRIVYWAAGDAEPREMPQYKSVAQKMGFEYNLVLGCKVSIENRKILDKHNNKINKKLSQKLGKDWRDNYYKKVDSLNVVYNKIIDKIQQNKLLWDTLTPMLEPMNNRFSSYFLHDGKSSLSFIMNYSEVDGFFNEGRVLYSLEVLLPDYKLKIIRNKN